MKLYNIVQAKEYTDKNGETKKAWIKVGTAFEKEGGKLPRMKLDALPLPDQNNEVWLTLFEQDNDKKDKMPF
tara:strand:+ start:261 stop:476 length:216 start_codon:yes stop_codon:yes gene_type:complete